jgi:hypothetical protein
VSFTECKITRANPRHMQNLPELVYGYFDSTQITFFNTVRHFFRENHFLSGLTFFIHFGNCVFIHPSHHFAHESNIAELQGSEQCLIKFPQKIFPAIFLADCRSLYRLLPKNGGGGVCNILCSTSIEFNTISWSFIDRGAVRNKTPSSASAICFGITISLFLLFV